MSVKQSNIDISKEWKLGQEKRIQTGDILVTSATDIDWSLYFPLLGRVVTVLGSIIISHGAMVAQECGLSCIVGGSNATD